MHMVRKLMNKKLVTYGWRRTATEHRSTSDHREHRAGACVHPAAPPVSPLISPRSPLVSIMRDSIGR
jgi:hypothetical protein